MREFEQDPLYGWLCDAIEMEDDPDQKLGLKRCRARLRIMHSSQAAWLCSARQALNGDMRSLRNRVEMVDAGPAQVVLS